VKKKTILQDAAYVWIHQVRPGDTFHLSKLYRVLAETFPAWCQERGEAAREERYENDARWRVDKAKREGLIEPTGERGMYRRLSDEAS